MQRKAVASGFYKRSSKLLPAKFFDVLLHSASVNGTFSLDQFSCEVSESHHVSISKQGLDNRFDETTVSFVKSIMEEQLSNQVGQSVDHRFLDKFSRVRIKDGTRFDLPQRLKDKLPGFGGKVTSDSAACIQYEFDLKNGRITDIDITSAKKTDYQDAKEKTGDIEKGDLIIRDLGYFSSRVLWPIIEKEAFFISRLRTKMTVFDSSLKEVSFPKLYSKMVKNKLSGITMNVFIGEKEMIPVRLIIDIVPGEVYQKRVMKTEKENKKKGHKTSEEYKARAHFNLIITNIPEDDLPDGQVYLLYKTRWQVELVFKVWKSTFGVNKIHPMNYNRLMCLLYAKLILILINNQIINLMANKFYKMTKKLLSTMKCMKTLLIYFQKTRETLKLKTTAIPDLMQNVARQLSANHWLESKKKKIGFNEIFDVFCNISAI